MDLKEYEQQLPPSILDEVKAQLPEKVTDAKLKKMSSITVEGADLAVEIRELTKKTFDSKTVPLMYALIDTICESKPLVFEWKNFK